MKRIISAVLAALLLLSLCSCAPQAGELEQSPEAIAQSEIIGTLGRTIKDSRIVAYSDENDYVKYIVVYYENGKKTDEETHYFYNNDLAFDRDKPGFEGETELVVEDEKRYISFKSNEAVGGSYIEDRKIIEQSYKIK